MQQELGAQDPSVMIKLVQIYFCSFYGSNLWDLYSESTNKLFISWNNFIRDLYNLPFATHRFILEDLVNITHLRTSLLRRFIKFSSALSNCSKLEVRHLFNLQKSDIRSVFGRNCIYMCREFNATSIDQISRMQISNAYITPAYDSWRVPFLKDLICLRDCNAFTDLTNTEINNLIDNVCSS